MKVPLDSKRRMDPVQLQIVLEQSGKAGLDIFAIVATACSTPIGAFDPLDEVAEIAKAKNIWLHVDGAHGASVLFSKKHRHLVKGIDRVDSLVWDAHKMMYVPALSTFVFYKSKEFQERAFQQESPYMRDPGKKEIREFDTFGGTLECTKRPLALGLWALWSVYGSSIFESLIDRTFERTTEFYQLLNDTKDFEPLHEPQSNILCFRYLPKGIKDWPQEQISNFQKTLREKLVRTGDYYTTATQLDGRDCLRVTLINPRTQRDDLMGLMDHLRKLGAL